MRRLLGTGAYLCFCSQVLRLLESGFIRIITVCVIKHQTCELDGGNYGVGFSKTHNSTPKLTESTCTQISLSFKLDEHPIQGSKDVALLSLVVILLQSSSFVFDWLCIVLRCWLSLS